MLEYLPCGCASNPVTNFVEIKEAIMAGNTVAIDNPKNPQANILYLQRSDQGNILLLQQKPSGTGDYTEITLDLCLSICRNLWTRGCDFSIGEGHFKLKPVEEV
ncbi:hypothetical protein V6C27_09625 [Peptococcaceae bacterium 1198_IL3148]